MKLTVVFASVLLALTTSLASAQITIATDHRYAPGRPPIPVRPSALAQTVSELAGYPVTVQRARILWVVDPHAVVIESDSLMGPRWRDSGRVLVLVERNRALAIPRPPLAIAPVTVLGVARTLLGIQAAHEVPWPAPLTRRAIDRLDIRAAILASSVRTAEGVELTSLVP